MTEVMILSGSIFAGLLVIGLILAKLYTRASKERSFVRTGAGGQKVIMNGGALVLPVLHEIIQVNMNTLRLEVSRRQHDALITKDRLRVDVVAEFYMRVKPDTDAIANAAQTLGQRTLQQEQLRAMIEGKFVDALRSVASQMEMDELHEQRAQFVQKVQQVVSEDLLKNGLELESVSLTGLDQTAKQYFVADNVFDAQGLAKMTRTIETRRKEVNDIEQETSVAIERKNLEAEQEKLKLDREKRYAQLEQQREIEIREAEQKTDIAKEQHTREQEAKQSEIEAQRQIEQSRIQAQKQTRAEEIVKEQELKAREIEKHKATELAEQDRAIAIAEKSKEQSQADQLASDARAKAVKAEEAVTTAREVEVAERHKQIELIEALKLAEKQATGIKVAAEAEKQAATDEAEAIKIQANAKAEAVKAEAEANDVKFRIEAEGQRLMNEALNALSESQSALKQALSLHQALPEIIAQAVKPMEAIDSMKIVNIDGINSREQRLPGSPGAGQSLPEALVNSALQHRAQAPLVDNLLKECGLSGLTNLAELADTAQEPVTQIQQTEAKAPEEVELR